MLELERLGVRVVSGRLGRKAGEEDDDEVAEKKSSGALLPSFTMRCRAFNANEVFSMLTLEP